MQKSTSINNPNFKISSNNDTSVDGFTLYENEKIQYLPVDIYIAFPNLIVIGAAKCLIKSISKRNFWKLRKLRKISLYDNQIEKIDDDTFDDQQMLEVLWLSKYSCISFKS